MYRRLWLLPLLLAFALSGATWDRGTTVPFTYFHHEIIVATQIGAAGPYNFFLDTDTTPSVIDLALARRLKLHMSGAPGSGSGVGSGSVSVFPLTIPALSVGAVRSKNLSSLATDLSGLSKHFGRRIDGVLGTSFFAGRVVAFNYPCRSVTFLDDATLEPLTARFHGDGDDLVDTATVNGRRATATFDTGDGGTAFITARGIKRLGLGDAARRGRVKTGYSYVGAARETAGRLDDVRVGNVDFGALPVFFTPTAQNPFDINIGNRTLEHHVVVFDYVRDLLTFVSPAKMGCPKL